MNDLEDRYNTKQIGTESLYIDKFISNKSSIGILLIHGFTGTSKTMMKLSKGLSEELNCSVSSPLLPGHGLDYNDPNISKITYNDWLNSIKDELQDLRRFNDHIYMVGFSMGGNLAMNTALTFNQDVEGIILINPLIELPAVRMVKYSIPLLNYISYLATESNSSNSEVKYKYINPVLIKELVGLCSDTKSKIKELDQSVLLITSTKDSVLGDTSREYLYKNMQLTDLHHINYLDNKIDHVLPEEDKIFDDLKNNIVAFIKFNRLKHGVVNNINKYLSNNIADNDIKYFSDEGKKKIKDFILSLSTEIFNIQLNVENEKEYIITDTDIYLNIIPDIKFPYLQKFLSSLINLLILHNVNIEAIDRLIKLFFHRINDSRTVIDFNIDHHLSDLSIQINELKSRYLLKNNTYKLLKKKNIYRYILKIFNKKIDKIDIRNVDAYFYSKSDHIIKKLITNINTILLINKLTSSKQFNWNSLLSFRYSKTYNFNSKSHLTPEITNIVICKKVTYKFFSLTRDGLNIFNLLSSLCLLKKTVVIKTCINFSIKEEIKLLNYKREYYSNFLQWKETILHKDNLYNDRLTNIFTIPINNKSKEDLSIRMNNIFLPPLIKISDINVYDKFSNVFESGKSFLRYMRSHYMSDNKSDNPHENNNRNIIYESKKMVLK